jgi:ATP-dependent RNA helicase DeaD
MSADEKSPEHETAGTGEAPGALAPVQLPDLPEMLQQAARNVGWTELMPVQSATIPYMLADRDVTVQSRTGSGKTGAFILPILQKVDFDRAWTQALVLVPTRELARQVARDAEELSKHTRLRCAALYGGVGYGDQFAALRQGAHLVVGTPGRILDHLMRESLSLARLRILVFDEADRMLSVGFYPDIKEMARYLPRERSGFMFSATYPPGVRELARRFLNEPEALSLSHGGEHVVEMEHVYYEVPGMGKDRSLVRIIEIENPESAIIFTNTRATANFVSVVLQRFGYDADHMSSDLPQNARERVLARVYAKKLRFLVATDLAARGIDVQGLSHVFLYEFPEDPESYIHRTGRTGRAGAGGEAISLVDGMERLRLKAVVARYGIDMQRREPPTDEEVQAVVAERVTALLEARLRGLDRLVLERMQRMVPLARGLVESDDEIAIIAMLLDEYYQSVLHAPPVPEPAETPEETGAAPDAEGSSQGGSRRRGGRRRRGRRK